MSTAGVAEARPAVKKRRSSKAEDDDDSKRRGRPRVEKNDESAADRRRTQIRMAQRAYRQRKESTLEELRRRVNELNGVVDTMEVIFQDCMDRLISSGLPDAAVNELRMTASRLAGLKNSSHALDISDDSIAERASTEQPSIATPQPEDGLTPKNVSTWLDQTEVSRSTRKPRVDDYVGLGYSIVLPENADESSLYPFRPHGANTAHAQPGMQRALPARETPVAHLPKEMPTTKTYSFQETTFARRVHRACLEAGYSLLLDPSRNQQIYERVFSLPLLARDRAGLAECTRDVLNRGVDETLELYDAPLIHIGGAGTHYPRRDKDGIMQHRKSAYNLGMVGPGTLKLLMQAGQGLTADTAVELAGFEGEWFDPYDVEGYLLEKGITIEPTASFTEVEVPASMQTLGDTASISSRPATPGLSHSSGHPASLMSTSESIDPSSMPWNYYLDSDLNEITAREMNASWMDPPPRKSTPHENGKKIIMVDVTKFIRGLMLSAVCLGQTPGFRRKDVDKALAYACYDLY